MLLQILHCKYTSTKTKRMIKKNQKPPHHAKIVNGLFFQLQYRMSLEPPLLQARRMQSLWVFPLGIPSWVCLFYSQTTVFPPWSLWKSLWWLSINLEDFSGVTRSKCQAEQLGFYLCSEPRSPKPRASERLCSQAEQHDTEGGSSLLLGKSTGARIKWPTL